MLQAVRSARQFPAHHPIPPNLWVFAGTPATFLDDFVTPYTSPRIRVSFLVGLCVSRSLVNDRERRLERTSSSSLYSQQEEGYDQRSQPDVHVPFLSLVQGHTQKLRSSVVQDTYLGFSH